MTEEENLTQEDTFKPFLYAIMPTDIPQMNPGKAMAQAMHLQQVASKVIESGPFSEKYVKWKEESSQKCFGTTIVLEGTSKEIELLCQTLENTGIFHCYCFGEAVDDEYPMVNHYGEPFTESRVTGYFVFAYSKLIQDIVRGSGLKLHR